MPKEAEQIKDAKVSLKSCPKCRALPFIPFMRGEIQRPTRKWLLGAKQPYCALICWRCKEIVGYENPDGSGFVPVK